jgi:hypothetical protein
LSRSAQNFFCSAKARSRARSGAQKISAHRARRAPMSRNFARDDVPESGIPRAFLRRAKICAGKFTSKKIFTVLRRRVSHRVHRAAAGGGTYTQN